MLWEEYFDDFSGNFVQGWAFGGRESVLAEVVDFSFEKSGKGCGGMFV